MILKVAQALNQPENKRMMKITSKPTGKLGDINIIKRASPIIMRMLAGRQYAYFLAYILPGGEVKLVDECKPPENEW